MNYSYISIVVMVFVYITFGALIIIAPFTNNNREPKLLKFDSKASVGLNTEIEKTQNLKYTCTAFSIGNNSNDTCSNLPMDTMSNIYFYSYIVLNIILLMIFIWTVYNTKISYVLLGGVLAIIVLQAWYFLYYKLKWSKKDVSVTNMEPSIISYINFFYGCLLILAILLAKRISLR